MECRLCGASLDFTLIFDKSKPKVTITGEAWRELMGDVCPSCYKKSVTPD